MNVFSKGIAFFVVVSWKIEVKLISRKLGLVLIEGAFEFSLLSSCFYTSSSGSSTLPMYYIVCKVTLLFIAKDF